MSLLRAAALIALIAILPAGVDAAAASGNTDLFHDPNDGAFDISQFLSTRTGFLPLLVPITEPAVGYGLALGLSFFHTPPRVLETPSGPRVIPPTASILAGMKTENGTWGTAAGHLHTWKDGRVRYLVGGGYASLNLDWFGQSDATAGEALRYEIDSWALVQKLTFKLGGSDFFAGPTQRYLNTTTEFDDSSGSSPGITSDELDATISGLGVALSYDTRNSLFSPSRGTKASLTATRNDGAIGSDFDYGRMGLEVCQYLPLGGPVTLGLRGDGQYAGNDSPFFDLASINLRGIQVGRYMDNVAVMLETEVRWDLAARWTVVGFGGAGWVADAFNEIDDDEAHWAGGAGFRYLIARDYDMRLGIDVARGPEDWAFYVATSTGWLRD